MMHLAQKERCKCNHTLTQLQQLKQAISIISMCGGVYLAEQLGTQKQKQ